MKIKEKEQRCEEFLSCLGSGKSIYQCEAENDLIEKTGSPEPEEI